MPGSRRRVACLAPFPWPCDRAGPVPGSAPVLADGSVRARSREKTHRRERRGRRGRSDSSVTADRAEPNNDGSRAYSFSHTSKETLISRRIGTCRVRNVPAQHSGGMARLAHSATGHSTGSARRAGSSVFEGGRRSPEQRGRRLPINHSSDHAVWATLGRQGRPRRPVLTFDIPGRCDRHPLSAPTSEQWCILNVALIESPFPASALTPRPRKVTVDLDHMARKALQHDAGSE